LAERNCEIAAGKDEPNTPFYAIERKALNIDLDRGALREGPDNTLSEVVSDTVHRPAGRHAEARESDSSVVLHCR
jgi:hypothetical protein